MLSENYLEADMERADSTQKSWCSQIEAPPALPRWSFPGRGGSEGHGKVWPAFSSGLLGADQVVLCS